MIREGSRRAGIVRAIRSGTNTSRCLADAFGMGIAEISSELHHLANEGVIVRGTAAQTKRGRPCIRYRVAEVAL